MSPQLIEFIERGLKDGKHPDTLRLEAAHLFNWGEEQFNDGLNHVMLNTASVNKVQPTVAPTNKKPWYKKFKIWGIVAVLSGVILGGGAYASYYFLPPTIDEIGGLVFDRLQTMESVEYSGTLQGEISTDASVSLENLVKYGYTQPANDNNQIAGSHNTKVRVDFNGATDIRDLSAPKSDLSFTITAEGFVVGMETKSISDDFFFKVTQMPDLGFFDVSEFLNQWFKISLKDVEELTGTSVEQEAGGGLTKEQEQRIRQVFVDHDIIKILEKLDSESIDGVMSHHYSYAIDEQELMSAVEEIYEITTGIQEEISPAEREEILEWIDLGGGEVWISKKDLTPVRITFEMSMRAVEDALATGKLSLDIKFKKYNEDVKIEAPESFQSLEDLIDGITEQSAELQGTQEKTSEMEFAPLTSPDSSMSN